MTEEAPSSDPTPSPPPSLPQDPFTYHPKQDVFLNGLEFCVVIFVGVSILGFVVVLIPWVFCGWPDEIVQRLAKIIRGLNNNWKTCLIVLIPLFFRPMRMFIEKIKKIGDIDTRQLPSEKVEGKNYRQDAP